MTTECVALQRELRKRYRICSTRSKTKERMKHRILLIKNSAMVSNLSTFRISFSLSQLLLNVCCYSSLYSHSCTLVHCCSTILTTNGYRSCTEVRENSLAPDVKSQTKWNVLTLDWYKALQQMIVEFSSSISFGTLNALLKLVPQTYRHTDIHIYTDIFIRGEKFSIL